MGQGRRQITDEFKREAVALLAEQRSAVDRRSQGNWALAL